MQLINADHVNAAMDKSAVHNVTAERLRLRANLWRRDAECAKNRQLTELMLRSAQELEEEAATLDCRTQAPATP